MNNNYNDPSYAAKVREVWEKFIKGENYDASVVRPVILESWQRTKKYGVNPHKKNAPVLSAMELKNKIAENQELLELVHPYIQKLYSIVKGSGFYILFSDKDGYILDLIGDDGLVQKSKATSLLVAGCSRKESDAGTNGISVSLITKKPIQVMSEEHYLESHKNYVCSGAPIISKGGEVLGTLTMTGPKEQVHPHTLGMVIAAVDGIVKEFNIKEANEKNELVSAQRNMIFESIDSALILLDTAYRITQINSNGLAILEKDFESVIHQNFFDLISFNESFSLEKNISFLQKEMKNNECQVFFPGTSKKPIRYIFTVNYIKDKQDNQLGLLIKINRVAKINKIVKDVGGFNAKYSFNSIIGTSQPIVKMIKSCKQSAQSSASVLILGESGTGKELVAQSIHNYSPRHNGPFIAINCGAIPRNLVESELFGYEKGSFTGAANDGSSGKFELADGGTVFLDEIGELPLDVQVSLLRVLQSKEILRIGGKHPKKIDVRIIAATNVDLEESVKAKTFREDLFYRINVFPIMVPPLRTRGEDVRILTDYFIENHNKKIGSNFKISPEVYSAFMNYSWPGNVRQLENVIERAVNICEGDEILLSNLPPSVLENKPYEKSAPTTFSVEQAPSIAPPPASASFAKGPSQSMKSKIEEALHLTEGNVTSAAQLLNLSRRTMYRKMEKYNISKDDYR